MRYDKSSQRARTCLGVASGFKDWGGSRLSRGMPPPASLRTVRRPRVDMSRRVAGHIVRRGGPGQEIRNRPSHWSPSFPDVPHDAAAAQRTAGAEPVQALLRLCLLRTHSGRHVRRRRAQGKDGADEARTFLHCRRSGRGREKPEVQTPVLDFYTCSQSRTDASSSNASSPPT